MHLLPVIAGIRDFYQRGLGDRNLPALDKRFEQSVLDGGKADADVRVNNQRLIFVVSTDTMGSNDKLSIDELSITPPFA